MVTFNDYCNRDTWEAMGILREVTFKASLSGGKGGQNVNKVNTKIELYWQPARSKILNEELRNKIFSRIGSKLSNEGELRIVCEEERSQLKNKQKAIEKFYSLLTNCFKVKKRRKPTKPTKASVKKRLEGKSKLKDLKAGRKRLDF